MEDKKLIRWILSLGVRILFIGVLLAIGAAIAFAFRVVLYVLSLLGVIGVIVFFAAMIAAIAVILKLSYDEFDS